MGEGPVSLQFPGIGTFGLIDGAWRGVVLPRPNVPEPVDVYVHGRGEFDEFRPSGEVERQWESGEGVVRVPLSSFKEIVDVGHVGRYRGEPVVRLGNVVEGVIAVGLVDEDPRTAARLDFSGDGRIETFHKRIAPAEFTDVVEEVTVMYRRDDGGGVDG